MKKPKEMKDKKYKNKYDRKMKPKFAKSKRISLEDVKYIMGDDFVHFKKIVRNVYCHRCRNEYESEIIDYTITLNHLGDIILKGFCKKCGGKVARYLETSESEKKRKRATKLLIDI